MKLFNIFSKSSSKDTSPKKNFYNNFLHVLKKQILGKEKFDEKILEKIENILLAADVGIDTTEKIISHINSNIKKNTAYHWENIKELLTEVISPMLIDAKDIKKKYVQNKPYIILVVGINGVGKTTTIAKLATYYKLKNKKVVIGAADTFRAAAVEQLQIWGKAIDIPVIVNLKTKDPKAVVYDTIQHGLKEKVDIIIIDTAGRLHNNMDLMQELLNIKKTIQKLIPEAPHETILTLDSTTGNNAFTQTAIFHNTLKVTSIAITKLDGSAKGGIIIGICDQYKIPIQYVGIGEKKEDLHFFDKKKYLKEIFDI